MRDRESVLGRLEERLSRVSRWLEGRRRGPRPGTGDLVARIDGLRDAIGRLRRAIGAVARQDLARVRATLDDLRTDYDVPPPHLALRPEELEAFGRYLGTVARLEPILSNLDDPRWEAAHAEYERAWAGLEHVFEAEGAAASP